MLCLLADTVLDPYLGPSNKLWNKWRIQYLCLAYLWAFLEGLALTKQNQARSAWVHVWKHRLSPTLSSGSVFWGYLGPWGRNFATEVNPTWPESQLEMYSTNQSNEWIGKYWNTCKCRTLFLRPHHPYADHNPILPLHVAELILGQSFRTCV